MGCAFYVSPMSDVPSNKEIHSTYKGSLRGKDNNLKELRQISKEIIDTRSLGMSPAMLALELYKYKRSRDRMDLLTSQVECTKVSSKLITKV